MTDSIGIVNATATASEPVDMIALLSLEAAQVEGEPDLIVELIELYAEDTPRRVTAIRGALARRDRAALQRAAHGLKGSSASLGARRVAALCDELEALSGEDVAREGGALFTRLEQEVERARLAFADERYRRLLASRMRRRPGAHAATLKVAADAKGLRP